MAPPKITIVGAGISGAACANALRRAGLSATVLDRGKVVGGRMASRAIGDRRVDTGASYFTVADPAFEAVVRRWADAGLAREWTDTFAVWTPAAGLTAGTSGPTRWSAPGGMRSLVATLLEDEDVRTGNGVTQVACRGGRPVVDSREADVAVLAMPDPQARRLFAAPVASGSGDFGLIEARTAVERVEYAPVIAVTTAWPARHWPFRDGVFVNDHPVLSFVADDGMRRGDSAPVLVSHTTEEAAAAGLDDADRAIDPVVAALRELFDLDSPRGVPTVTRWTFAKPTGTHGDEPFLLTDDGIGLAGDSWCPSGSPRVEAAWLSGDALGTAIAERLT